MAKTATLASLADTPETKRVNFDLTAEQHAKLKMYVARHGTTIKELFAAYVDGLQDK
ncbi:plasmid partition protein ParG [Achromobacter sp. NPDC058515]|uniref:plasmid partition protein ParG n=1 Tax=Achromobacter sp. NPDC058515 TaxID=3346533 RepID=UPI0036487469